MKAAVCTKYGSPEVVQLREIAKPVPKENEVLIKVKATTVSTADWRIRSGKLPKGFGLIGRLVFGISKPRNAVLGTELTGMVEEIGSKVTQFKIGDEVVAYPDVAMRAHAEYRCLSQNSKMVLKPENLKTEEAAALCFGAITSLGFLRDKAKIKSGEKILVIGASGALGSAAVQLAKHFGAHVTGVTSSANIALVRLLGADEVIDYTKENWLQKNENYDVIYDTVTGLDPAQGLSKLKTGGRLILAIADLPQMLSIVKLSSKNKDKKIIAGAISGNLTDVQFMADLAAAGKFKPLIDQVYPFEKISEAHAHVETGHKKGNVVVKIND